MGEIKFKCEKKKIQCVAYDSSKTLASLTDCFGRGMTYVLSDADAILHASIYANPDCVRQR